MMMSQVFKKYFVPLKYPNGCGCYQCPNHHGVDAEHSMSCHSECEKWAEYQAERNAVYENKLKIRDGTQMTNARRKAVVSLPNRNKRIMQHR